MIHFYQLLPFFCLYLYLKRILKFKSILDSFDQNCVCSYSHQAKMIYYMSQQGNNVASLLNVESITGKLTLLNVIARQKYGFHLEVQKYM